MIINPDIFVKMSFNMRILALLVVYLCGTLVHGTPCSKENRTQDLSTCLSKITTELFEPNRYWFGSEYASRCPSGEDSGIFCRNPKPSATSIHVRLFSTMDYTSGLDRFLELNFESGGMNYEACGNSYKSSESWRLDADPTSGTVVDPWFVKNFPVSVYWTYNITILEYYTLMVYDAGYLVSRGLYVNIPQNKIDDIAPSEIIQHYGGPLLAMDIKNPYVFLLFKQNGSITVSEEWKNKVTNGNLAGSWTIDEFASAMNMQGLVAINWITVTGDEWSAQTMMEKQGPYAMCPVFATKALHRKDRTFIPTDVQLSVWLDFEFMPPTDKTINVCCKETKYSARNFSLNPLGDQNFSTWEVRSESPHKLTLSKLGYFVERHNFTGDMYTLISVDPDVPLPAAGTETRPILHGLVTNIMDGSIKTGDFGLHWAGPFPPNDLPHYYYTLLYKQQSTLNGTEMRFNYAGNACSSRLYGRCLYDINRAVAENNLTLVGATWFTSQKDAYVLERQLNQTGSDEAEVCKGQPGYSNPCTTGAATVVFPSIVNVCITISFLLAFMI